MSLKQKKKKFKPRKQLNHTTYTNIQLGYLKDSNAAAHSVDTGIS